jgi:hypothetical protein
MRQDEQAEGKQTSKIIDMNTAVLHLVLKRKWFDMIKSGEKKEEYRDITPYWSRKFANGKIKIKGKYYHPTDVVLCFSLGYTMNRIAYKCEGMKVGFPKSEWAINFYDQKFILQIGERIL